MRDEVKTECFYFIPHPFALIPAFQLFTSAVSVSKAERGAARLLQMK